MAGAFRCLRLFLFITLPIYACSYRLDCGGVPKYPAGTSTSGICAHFRGDVLEASQSPGHHLVDSSKIVFNFRLYGCLTDDPSMPNMSYALRGYPEDNFALYEGNRVLVNSPNTELSFSVKHQKDHLFNFVTLLIDMSKSVTTSDKYFIDLKKAVRELVESILPVADSTESYKLKVQVVAFAGGSDRDTVTKQLLSYRCANDVRRDLEKLLMNLPHPSELFEDYKSTALNLAVSSSVADLIEKVETIKAHFVAGTLIVFTDGDDTSGTYSEEALFGEIDAVPSSVSLFAVGVGNLTDEKLERIGKNGFVRVTNSTNLEEGFSKVSQKLLSVTQNRYYVEYCSPKRKGEHVLLVQLTNQTSGSACRFHFDASEFTPECRLGVTMPQLYQFGCVLDHYEPEDTSGSERYGMPTALTAAVILVTFAYWYVLP